MFDFALVRDRALVERLNVRRDEDARTTTTNRTARCAMRAIGIFYGHGDAWLHSTGEGTVASPVDLYDAGHEPAVAWRPAGAR